VFIILGANLKRGGAGTSLRLFDAVGGMYLEIEEVGARFLFFQPRYDATCLCFVI